MPEAQAAATNLLLQVQAFAYNLVIASQRDKPNFSLHMGHSPLLYNHSGASADFNYGFYCWMAVKPVG